MIFVVGGTSAPLAPLVRTPMMTKPMKNLELHYPKFQFLITVNSQRGETEKDTVKDSNQNRNRPFPSYLVPLLQNESACKFDLHKNEPVGGTHFQMNAFARRLVLTKRQKATWKYTMAYTIWIL